MAVSNFIPQIWSSAVLQSFRAAEVVTPLTNRQYEGDARSGNQVKVTSLTIGDGTPVQDYALAGRTHTVDSLADSTTPILINQEKALAFKVDDVDRVQAAGSFDTVTGDAAKHLTEDAETYIIGRMTTEGTNANPDPDGAGAGVPATIATPADAYNVVRKLRKVLAKADVPSEGRYLLVNPDFVDLMLDEAAKLTSVDVAGSDGELRNGVLGRLLGFTVVESSLLEKASAKPAAIGFHRSAVAYVNQIERVEAMRSTDSFADVVRMLHVYGSKVIRPTACQYYISQ